MATKTIRLITIASDGSFREREYDDFDDLKKMHEQIGIDDCSTDLSLRGFPVFRGLIGPIPENKNVARYESPEVFETLTKEWSLAKTKRRRRRSSSEIAAQKQNTTATPTPMAIPNTGTLTSMPGEFV